MIFGAFLSMLLTMRFILIFLIFLIILRFLTHTESHDVILACINFFVH